MSAKRLLYFNFQHRLDLDYPLTYGTAPPCHVQPSPSEYLFCPWWNMAAVQRTQKLHHVTLLNGTFLMCLWDLGAWTCALKSDVLGKSHPVLQTSVEVFTFFQGKKFCSLQSLNWHGKIYVRSKLVQCLNVLVKKHLRVQEPSFSHAWEYWNLVFISEAIWEWSRNQSRQNILAADKSLNEHLDHSGGSWVSTRTTFMISSRACLYSVAMTA